MTNFIYRGITHTGTQASRPRPAQDLLYRGARHDGLAVKGPRATRTAQMCYRGVHYVARQAGQAQAGATAPSAPVPGAILA